MKFTNNVLVITLGLVTLSAAAFARDTGVLFSCPQSNEIRWNSARVGEHETNWLGTASHWSPQNIPVTTSGASPQVQVVRTDLSRTGGNGHEKNYSFTCFYEGLNFTGRFELSTQINGYVCEKPFNNKVYCH